MPAENREVLISHLKNVLRDRFNLPPEEVQRANEEQLKVLLEQAIRRFLIDCTEFEFEQINPKSFVELYSILNDTTVGDHIPEDFSVEGRYSIKADASELLSCAAMFVFIEKPTLGRRIATFVKSLR